MVEKLDNTAEIIKEVYARYGVAMYFAQHIEMSISVLLTTIKMSRGKIKTDLNYDFHLEKNFKTTLGRLIGYIKEVIEIDDKLEEDLEELLNLRNYLAHSYFRENSINFKKKDGRHQILSELKSIRQILEAGNKKIELISIPIFKHYGLTAERLKEIEKEMLPKEYL